MIDDKAKKCPKCQADQRNWFAKHPVITVILVIVAISIFSSKGSKSNTNTTNTKSSTTTKQEEVIAKIGEAVSDKELSFKITNISKAKTLGSYSRVSAQGTFNVITLEIKNEGKETKTIDSSMLKVVDGQGRKFDRSIEGQTAKGLSQGKVDLFLQQVQPGLSVTGDIVFDLPDDATDAFLVVQGSMFSTGKKILLSK